MNYTKVFKRETKVIAYVVICLTLVVMGVSYALFLQVNSNTNNQVVTTGSLQIEYSEMNDIVIGENDCLIPQSDEDAIHGGACVYTLSITNKGSLPMQYSLLIYDNDSQLPEGGEKVSHSLIRHALTKTIGETTSTVSSGVALEEVPFKEEKRSLETNMIAVGETIVFNLKIWIDENAPSEGENGIIGKYVYLKLDVTGTVYENETAIDVLTATMDVSGLSEVMLSTPVAEINQDLIKEYRYSGKNPNNYILYNCSNDEDTSTCEKWRILGIYNIDGESRVKLIKDTSEEVKSWDDSALVSYSTSSLNTYLNSTYYNSLSETAKGQIGVATYSLCGAENLDLNSKATYDLENKSNDIASFNVGLMSVSDYAFASSLKEEDFVSTIASRNENNWLFTGQEEWLVNKSINNQVYKISSNGSIGVSVTNIAKLIRPVVTLQSSVKIIGGDGTKENPYMLSK